MQGLSGFAFGLIALAFWAWAMPPDVAGPLVVGCSLLGQLLSFPAIRRDFDAQRALPFIAGGVVGVPLGAWLLPQIDQTIFKASVGALLVLWCPAMLLLRDLPRITVGGRGADAAVGWIGGVMGGLGGLSGPAPTLWCNLRGWDKASQRSVFQAFHLSMHTTTLAFYVAGGLVNGAALRLFAVAAPAMLIPTLLGARLYGRVSDTGFRRVVLLLLLGSGVVLLADTLPRLIG